MRTTAYKDCLGGLHETKTEAEMVNLTEELKPAREQLFSNLPERDALSAIVELGKKAKRLMTLVESKQSQINTGE